MGHTSFPSGERKSSWEQNPECPVGNNIGTAQGLGKSIKACTLKFCFYFLLHVPMCLCAGKCMSAVACRGQKMALDPLDPAGVKGNVHGGNRTKVLFAFLAMSHFSNPETHFLND